MWLVLLLVEILHLGLLAVGGLQRVSSFVDAVERGAADEVFQTAFVEGVPFARLAKIHFHDQPRLIVDRYFQSLAEITGLVRRHGSSLLRWMDGVGYSQFWERQPPLPIVGGTPGLHRRALGMLVEK